MVTRMEQEWGGNYLRQPMDLQQARSGKEVENWLAVVVERCSLVLAGAGVWEFDWQEALV